MAAVSGSSTETVAISQKRVIKAEEMQISWLKGKKH